MDTYHIGNAIREAEMYDDHEIGLYGKREKETYRQYAGKIICVGKVTGNPYRDNGSGWSDRLMFAEIGNLQLIKSKLTSKEINDFLMINRWSSVTNVRDDQWKRLRALLLERNPDLDI